MVKKLITEISEEDFRKLDLSVARNERVEHPNGGNCFGMVERKVNDILDEVIGKLIESGSEEDLRFLSIPVTIAIHEDDGYYLDKFMNRFTGAQTYQLGVGIAHLYSTRDYYEAHEDYWRVRKDETKVIYRIKLSSAYIDKFVLKHKTEVKDWPYDELPEGVSPDYDDAKLEIHYDLVNDEFVEVGRTGVFTCGVIKSIMPVDKEGHRIKPDWYN